MWEWGRSSAKKSNIMWGLWLLHFFSTMVFPLPKLLTSKLVNVETSVVFYLQDHNKEKLFITKSNGPQEEVVFMDLQIWTMTWWFFNNCCPI